ncbi:linear primary-alkylsulfatase [Ciona intestinalis]
MPNKLLVTIAVLAIAYYARYKSGRRHSAKQDQVVITPIKALADLEKHSEKFNVARVEKVTEGVYVAIGYAIANMIMLEGTDGIIIVDTTESKESALKAMAEFRKITNKPLKGIVLTHFHADHLVGADGLIDQAAESGNPSVNIYAHASLDYELTRFYTISEYGFFRGSRQFGTFLNHGKEAINAGIGFKLMVPRDMSYNVTPATHTYQDKQTYNLAGITFQLIHTPGESDDQTTVWLPDKRVVLPADNIYEAFPNLYAIRGAPARDCRQWADSLDIVRDLKAEYMVPSHTRPLVGEKKVYDTITSYRDAIQFVYDQTVRFINKRWEVDDIVKQVRLPNVLATHPYLQEFYGTVEWSVRGVYDSLNGWFDGDPVNLSPLSKKERAKRFNALLESDLGDVSGPMKMLNTASSCLAKSSQNLNVTGYHLHNELQWALELSSMALKAADPASEEYEQAKLLYVEALQSLATMMKSANGRNYYLTCAREISSGLKITMSPLGMKQTVAGMGLSDIMRLLPFRFNAEACNDEETFTIAFRFPDTDTTFSYTVRHCIAEYKVNAVLASLDAKLTVSSEVWKNVLIGKRNAVAAYAAGELQVEGSWLTLKRFLDLLETSVSDNDK